MASGLHIASLHHVPVNMFKIQVLKFCFLWVPFRFRTITSKTACIWNRGYVTFRTLARLALTQRIRNIVTWGNISFACSRSPFILHLLIEQCLSLSVSIHCCILLENLALWQRKRNSYTMASKPRVLVLGGEWRLCALLILLITNIDIPLLTPHTKHT